MQSGIEHEGSQLEYEKNTQKLSLKQQFNQIKANTMINMDSCQVV
jgi:hypothetical protein